MSNETTLDDVLALVPVEPTLSMWDSTENALIEAEIAYEHGDTATRDDAHSWPTLRIWQAVVAYRAMLAAAPAWHPTAEAINALPQPLRDYIHTIQTSHPSYDNAVKVKLLEEKVAMLERALGEGWQAISSCPDSGEVVMFHVPGESQPTTGRADDWHSGQAMWLDGATHWRPLPTPPDAMAAGPEGAA